MFAGNNISFIYFFFGVISSLFVAVASYRVGIIQKKSELLYLSIGFYRYFIKLYLDNFFSSINLILSLALEKNENCKISTIEIYDEKLNLGLLIAAINISSGIISASHRIDDNKKILLIHSVDDKYLERFDLYKNIKIINNLNEDDIV
jgi:hypothetical protein